MNHSLAILGTKPASRLPFWLCLRALNSIRNSMNAFCGRGTYDGSRRLAPLRLGCDVCRGDVPEKQVKGRRSESNHWHLREATFI